MKRLQTSEKYCSVSESEIVFPAENIYIYIFFDDLYFFNKCWRRSFGVTGAGEGFLDGQRFSSPAGTCRISPRPIFSLSRPLGKLINQNSTNIYQTKQSTRHRTRYRLLSRFSKGAMNFLRKVFFLTQVNSFRDLKKL